MSKKEENEILVPQRRNPGSRMMIPEKAKDFKGAIKRLLKELGKFKYLILISIILAFISTILQIITPNRLSKLTDEITIGLTVKQDKLMEVVSGVKNSLEQEKIITRCKEALLPALTNANLDRVMSDNTLTEEEKNNLRNVVTNLDYNDINTLV